MNLQRLFFVCIIASITISCSKSKKDRTVKKEDIEAILDKTMNSYKAIMANSQVGIGLYIKGDGTDTYVSSGFPAEYKENIQFRGASTTKTFTATAVLKLQEQGKLNIDDKITANIPGTNQPYIPDETGYNVPFKNNITIRQLLNHRAGVFDVTNTNIPEDVAAPYAGRNYVDYLKEIKGQTHTFQFAELIEVVAKHQLSYFEPNVAFHYSNTGYNMLAVIIERVSGKPLHQYFEDEFLKPLKMDHTHFPHRGDDRELPLPSLASWLKFDNQFTSLTLDNVSSAASEGNIVTTPKDLTTWAHNLYASKRVLRDASLADMTTGLLTKEEHVKYGLGCEFNPADIGYGHNGARPGYMTMMRYHPGTHKTYVLFCNFFNFDAFAQQALDMEAIIRETIQAYERAD